MFVVQERSSDNIRQGSAFYVILHHAYELKDVLTCIDDFHPCGRQEEQKLTSTAQSIMRAYGDRTGRGRLKADSSPMNSRPPQGNALITAEFAPDIGESGTARYFALELKNDEVDLSMLSSIQIEAAKGVLANSMRAYIEMVSEIANQNEEEFIKTLRKSFEFYRDEFNECGIKCHGRVPEIVAWLRIGMRMFLNFLKKHEMILPERIDEINIEFKKILHGIAKRQSENIEQDKPTYKFIRKLISLIESGSVGLAAALIAKGKKQDEDITETPTEEPDEVEEINNEPYEESEDLDEDEGFKLEM